MVHGQKVQAGQEGEHVGRFGELKSDKLGPHPTPVTPGKVFYGLTFHYQMCPSEGNVLCIDIQLHAEPHA